MASQLEATQATQPVRESSTEGGTGAGECAVPADAPWGRLVQFGSMQVTELVGRADEWTLGRRPQSSMVVEHLQARTQREREREMARACM
jgi:hypothetical protein